MNYKYKICADTPKSSAFIGFYNLCSWRKDQKFLEELTPIIQCENKTMKKTFMKALLVQHKGNDNIQMGRSMDYFLKIYLKTNTTYKRIRIELDNNFKSTTKKFETCYGMNTTFT